MQMNLRESIRRSVLWSAYGDALGFIAELCNKSMFVKRTHGVGRVTTLLAWTRRVGGRGGIQIELPAGCYSDDTQLRLATCRSISADGEFDAETFAKVELPIWLSYQLGAGRGSKAGADSLKKNNISWNSNFYRTQFVQYVDSGGNGAAMRIQPHVWSADINKKPRSILRDVIRNTIITHGHCRALVGAAFHAMCLHQTMLNQQIPGPMEWFKILRLVSRLPEVVQDDEELNLHWLASWETNSKMPFEEGIAETVNELQREVELAAQVINKCDQIANKEGIYPRLVQEIGGFDKKQMGSAIKTSLLAAFLGYVYRNNPHKGLVEAANLLGTDTDTIATMAGAILGATANADPPEEVADIRYLEFVSERLYKQSLGRTIDNHLYPDLLQWEPPKAQVDAIGLYKGELVLQGFGNIKPIRQHIELRGSKPFLWQWVQLDFGQTLLIKMRHNPINVGRNSLPSSLFSSVKVTGDDDPSGASRKSTHKQEQTSLFSERQKSERDAKSHHLDDSYQSDLKTDMKSRILKRISQIEEEIVNLKAMIEREL